MFVLLALLCVAPALSLGSKPEDGLIAPAFSLPDLSGKAVSLSDYKGKVILLNFWASWCPPCRAEMPSLQKLSNSLKDKKFVVLAVGLDQDQEQIRSFINSERYAFKVLLDPESRAARIYNVTLYPTSFILDKKGVIKHKVVGATDWTDVKVVKELKKLADE